jgi:hypothetical protein
MAIGKLASYAPQGLVKPCESRFFDVRRTPSEKGMGDSARAIGDGVAVATDRHRFSHGVFVIAGLKENR